jgi:hypothetical protein
VTPLACDAAAIELEAYAKELLATAATLRRFAQTMAREPTVKVAAIVNGPELAKATLPPCGCDSCEAREAAQRPAAPRSSKATRTHKGDTDAAVRAALGVQERSLPEIAKRAKLNPKTAYRQLQTLCEAKVVTKRREGHAMRYRLVTPGDATPRRSGQAAGTPAGSAGGSVPDRRNSSADDVVWNGTLERNGQAPPILPPRERKP